MMHISDETRVWLIETPVTAQVKIPLGKALEYLLYNAEVLDSRIIATLNGDNDEKFGLKDLYEDLWITPDGLTVGPPKCECGSGEDVGPVHSRWCPMYNDEPAVGSRYMKELKQEIQRKNAKNFRRKP